MLFEGYALSGRSSLFFGAKEIAPSVLPIYLAISFEERVIVFVEETFFLEMENALLVD